MKCDYMCVVYMLLSFIPIEVEVLGNVFLCLIRQMMCDHKK